MGLTIANKLSMLVILLLVAGGIVHFGRVDSQTVYKNPESLSSYLSDIPNWHQKRSDKLARRVVNLLNLDDYLNSEYRNGGATVSLYIGQYNSSGKIGAAHDPMVCFPGQGWKVEDTSTGETNVELSSSENHYVSYSTMLVESGENKQFILYWFQALDATHPNTFFQKLSNFKNTVLGRGGYNSFVRISAPIEDRSVESVKQSIFDFINDFYPLYLEYIHKGSVHEG